MSGTHGQFVRRQLGRKMRSLRLKVGKSTEDVDDSKIVSRMTLHRIEAGKQTTPQRTVLALCVFYGADPATTQTLVAMAEAMKGRGWAEDYGDVVPETLQLYLDCELLASEISIYDPEVVPGALQTAEYARAIFAGEGKDLTTLDRLLEARLKRQERFWAMRPAGARYCVVLSQAALVREVDSHATMQRQLNHMRQIGESWSNADIRVLSWSAGAHPAIYGGYTIFGFPDDADPTVVYTEGYGRGQYVDEPDYVARMLKIQDTIYRRAVSIKEYA